MGKNLRVFIAGLIVLLLFCGFFPDTRQNEQSVLIINLPSASALPVGEPLKSMPAKTPKNLYNAAGELDAENFADNDTAKET